MRYLIYCILLLLLVSCGRTDPDYEIVSRSLDSSSPGVSALRKRIRAAFDAYEQRDVSAALEQLDALVSSGITHPVLLYRLAVVTRASGREEKAKSLFERAAAAFKSQRLLDHRYAAYSLIGVGNYYLRKKELTTAGKWYGRAVAIRKKDPLILTRIGRLYFQQAEYALAVSYLQRVKGHLPGLLLLAEAYLKLERFVAANRILKPLYSSAKPLESGGNIRIAMDYGLSLIGIAQAQAKKREYREAYKNAFKAREIYTRITIRFREPDKDPFLSKLPADRRKYFITRSREYLQLCAQMVRKYEKHLH